jgi:hypothetical protein
MEGGVSCAGHIVRTTKNMRCEPGGGAGLPEREIKTRGGKLTAGHTHRKRQILQPVQALSTEGPLSSLCLSA